MKYTRYTRLISHILTLKMIFTSIWFINFCSETSRKYIRFRCLKSKLKSDHLINEKCNEFYAVLGLIDRNFYSTVYSIGSPTTWSTSCLLFVQQHEAPVAFSSSNNTRHLLHNLRPTTRSTSCIIFIQQHEAPAACSSSNNTRYLLHYLRLTTRGTCYILFVQQHQAVEAPAAYSSSNNTRHLLHTLCTTTPDTCCILFVQQHEAPVAYSSFAYTRDNHYELRANNFTLHSPLSALLTVTYQKTRCQQSSILTCKTCCFLGHQAYSFDSCNLRNC